MSAADPWPRTLAGKPTVGASAERSRRTSMRDVEMFTDMTGDRNPLHVDPKFAAIGVVSVPQKPDTMPTALITTT